MRLALCHLKSARLRFENCKSKNSIGTTTDLCGLKASKKYIEIYWSDDRNKLQFYTVYSNEFSSVVSQFWLKINTSCSLL